MPKRRARALRLESSSSRCVGGRLVAKSGFGAVVSVDFVAAVSEVSVVGAGGSTVRSEVLEGSMSTFWLGTAVGLGGWVRPPAAMAAAAGGSVATAASSSQSISSSAPSAGAAFAASCSASYFLRRSMSSAFLPVCGRERAFRRSSSSAFFFFE